MRRPRFSRIFLKSRTNRWELTDPSYWPIIEAMDSLFSAVLTERFPSWLIVLDVGKSTHPRPQSGPIRRWRMCKRVTFSAFTSSRIFAKMPPVGDEPETLNRPVAQTITQLTKWPKGNGPPAPLFQALKTERLPEMDTKKASPPRPRFTDSKRNGPTAIQTDGRISFVCKVSKRHLF